MLKRLEITNYRSIAQAEIDFKPFTILIGANGSGKSNLLKLIGDLAQVDIGHPVRLARHYQRAHASTAVTVVTDDDSVVFRDGFQRQKPPELRTPRTFAISPDLVGGVEALTDRPEVEPNGSGVVRVLDSLKTGDREDLFNTIEQKLREFIPEIEKLSFAPAGNVKRLQVRERSISMPVPVSELSEGTRLVLTILTIVFQERKPSIICIEDLDRGLHPALFGKVVEVCRNLATSAGGPQIIATTHNPYLVDQFVDDEDSVILVDKKDGNTTFASLRKRLEGVDRADNTLGSLWYYGLVGGIPERMVRHLKAGERPPES